MERDDDSDAPTEFLPSLSGSRRVAGGGVGESGTRFGVPDPVVDATGEEVVARRFEPVLPPPDRMQRDEDELPIDRIEVRRDPDTDGKIRSPGARIGRKVLTRGLPIALLVAVSGWSLYELSTLETPVREPKTAEAVEAGEVPAKIEEKKAEAPVAAEPEPEAEEMPVLGKKLGGLLEGVDLVRVRPPETTEALTLKQAVVEDGVTVINLWATWCGPCRRELPGLKEMFESGKTRWGNKVRFVPIRVSDGRDHVWSYENFQDTMPATDYFLIDDDVNGGVRKPLEDAQIIRKKQSLPVTIVLDCRQSIRWHHAGEIKGGNFEELTKTIDELRAASAQYCRKAKPKTEGASGTSTPVMSATPSAPISPTVKACGDGVCGRREDCHSCAPDCKCRSDEKCKQQTDGGTGWFCKEAI